MVEHRKETHMEYKVGEKVTIIKEPKGTERLGFTDEMKKLCGKKLTIAEIEYNPVIRCYAYRMKEKKAKLWLWSEEMFAND